MAAPSGRRRPVEERGRPQRLDLPDDLIATREQRFYLPVVEPLAHLAFERRLVQDLVPEERLETQLGLMGQKRLATTRWAEAGW